MRARTAASSNFTVGGFHLIKAFSKDDTSAIKGIAILLMLNHHNFLSPSRYEGYTVNFFPFSENTVVAFSSFGKICVSIFVFLSAYGLTLSLKKYSSSTTLNGRQYQYYLVPRLIKLMWGFWFAFIFSFIACIFIAPKHISVYSSAGGVYGLSRGIINAVIDFFGLSSLFGSPTLDGTWWYMTLAIFIVIVVPLFAMISKKLGILAVALLTIFVPRIIVLGSDFEIGGNSNVLRYLFVVFLGVLFAQNDLLVRMKEYSIFKNRLLNKFIKFVGATVLLIIFYIMRASCNSIDEYTFELRDGIIPIFVIYYCYEFIIDIPIIRQVLLFLGKYSMDIFLTHTFIRLYLFADFTYSFKNWLLIDLVLLLDSLAVAIAMHFIKKFTRYDRLLSVVLKKVNNKISKGAVQ